MAHDLLNLDAEDGRDIITDSTQTGLNIVQSGTGEALGVDGSSTGDGLSIDQSSTGKGVDISTTTGTGVEVDSTGLCVDVNAGDTTGAYNAIDIVMANYSHPTVGALKITTSCSSAPVLEITGLGSMSYASGSAAWTVQGRIRVKTTNAGGTSWGWIPIFT